VLIGSITDHLSPTYGSEAIRYGIAASALGAVDELVDAG
jgi:hypothetical protein